MSKADKIVSGRYRVLNDLASGGMGKVVLAEQLGIERTVVVKFIHPHAAHATEDRERFQREARLLSRLNHPNIVSVHDFGEQDDGTLYLVMEYIEGDTLSQLRRRLGGRLTPPHALELAEQICLGLAEAHENQLVHRDLKPANIMVARKAGDIQVVKLLDFGLVKPLDESPDEASLTSAHVVLGTPHYMAPEQIRALPLDGRADLYALGVILYELLTGARPFQGATSADLYVAHLTVEAQPMRAAHPELPAALDGLVLGLLSKSPDDRPSSAEATLRLMRAIRESMPSSIPDAIPQTLPHGPAPRLLEQTSPGLPSPRSASVIDAPTQTLAPEPLPAPSTNPAETPPPQETATPTPTSRLLTITLTAILSLFAGGLLLHLFTDDNDPPPSSRHTLTTSLAPDTSAIPPTTSHETRSDVSLTPPDTTTAHVALFDDAPMPIDAVNLDGLWSEVDRTFTEYPDFKHQGLVLITASGLRPDGLLDLSDPSHHVRLVFWIDRLMNKGYPGEFLQEAELHLWFTGRGIRVSPNRSRASGGQPFQRPRCTFSALTREAHARGLTPDHDARLKVKGVAGDSSGLRWRVTTHQDPSRAFEIMDDACP